MESEYYPPMHAWDPTDKDYNIDNLIERAQNLKASYENRARFARNINLYIGKEGETSFKNRGYCVVTYSTYE